MRAKLFVGNLSWGVDSAVLEEFFANYGEISSARVVTDRETGRSRGFGFVEIDADDIAALISSTNGQELDGRPIRVNEAEDRERGGGGGGGGGGYRGGGGGGGYRGGGGGDNYRGGGGRDRY